MQFDWCAFGGKNKRSSTFVTSSTAFKRIRWTCTEQDFEHQHSRCADQSSPSALTHFLVFFCVHCVDGALVPLFFITADRLPRRLFCHVLSDVFVLSLDDHNGKVVCAGLHWSVIFAVLFVTDKQFLAALQELCFPVLPHVTHEVSQKGRWSASTIPNFQKAGDWCWAETADTQLRRTATVNKAKQSGYSGTPSIRFLLLLIRPKTFFSVT